MYQSITLLDGHHDLLWKSTWRRRTWDSARSSYNVRSYQCYNTGHLIIIVVVVWFTLTAVVTQFAERTHVASFIKYTITLFTPPTWTTIGTAPAFVAQVTVRGLFTALRAPVVTRATIGTALALIAQIRAIDFVTTLFAFAPCVATATVCTAFALAA